MRTNFLNILSELQSFYGHKSDADTARFLGISTQSLSNWKKSDKPDLEILIEKCGADFDLNQLFLNKKKNKVSLDEVVAYKTMQVKLVTLAYEKQLQIQSFEGDAKKKLQEEAALLKETSILLEQFYKNQE